MYDEGGAADRRFLIFLIFGNAGGVDSVFGTLEGDVAIDACVGVGAVSLGTMSR